MTAPPSTTLAAEPSEEARLHASERSRGLAPESGRRAASAALLARRTVARPPQPVEALTLARLLRPSEHWRLYPDLREGARFIDIETLGLAPTDPITLVGISDGYFSTVLVRGRDLTRERLWEALADARLLVTFCGATFDVPRLRAAFPGLPAWDLPHVDLAVLGRRVGLRGGLKAVERQLGRRRPQGLRELAGADAVRLWEAYQAGDRAALTRLTQYCRADTEALQAIAPRIYERLAEQSGESEPGWLRGSSRE